MVSLVHLHIIWTKFNHSTEIYSLSYWLSNLEENLEKFNYQNTDNIKTLNSVET